MTRTVFALARYEDPAKAIDFLAAAFGFTAHQVSKDDSGAVVHAELLIGEDMIMIGKGQPGGPGIYVAVDDPDAHHDHAKAAGATITMELVDQSYGSREYGCADPGGNTWYFGTYRP
ncbi:VOC family protein [Nonomuraea sp. NPDC050547]|uniref:VOC family protein n=1 Tax=Nonomuraea sp. NPDC050547 TaxID=3364368 RepID=UPI00378A1612